MTGLTQGPNGNWIKRSATTKPMPQSLKDEIKSNYCACVLRDFIIEIKYNLFDLNIHNN